MPTQQISQYIVDKKRQNRRQLIWAVSLATLTVLGMTYYDLKFHDYTPKDIPAIEHHYIASDADVALVPDDYTELTIWQGILTPQPDGSVKMTGAAAVTPVNFPQRQVDLFFGLSALPEGSQKALSSRIGDVIHAWENKSNLVMDALIDTRDLNGVSLATLTTLMQDLGDDYVGEYRYTLVVDPLDHDDILVKADEAARQDFLKTIAGLSIRVTADKAATAIAAADKLGHRFSVMVPPGTDITTFETDAAAKAKHFVNFIRDIAPTAKPAE